ncbi:uncharacterized protein LOC110447311 [Mizuhopecten yessoensis]|uniref:uncharacterized protein LOC110447311 n=1 Tax=Mizuhopecten yessoensis TaxID=6573 RepID=UPI000B4579B9|nr:uncharacterized protein LOC110447311 [Mizuhopecten yessoensis]
MVKSILTHFEEAMLRIGNLRNGYRADRVNGQTSTELCSLDFDLDNIFKHVPRFPDMDLVHGNILDLCSEISTPLLSDYEKMTSVMIFLEQTIREEDYYSGGQFTPDLGSMHDSIKQAMCLFQRLENRCIPSQSTRNSTDLLNNYEQTTAGKRYERDYLLVKDTHILLKGFWIKYNKCYELFTNSF